MSNLWPIKGIVKVAIFLRQRPFYLCATLLDKLYASYLTLSYFKIASLMSMEGSHLEMELVDRYHHTPMRVLRICISNINLFEVITSCLLHCSQEWRSISGRLDITPENKIESYCTPSPLAYNRYVCRTRGGAVQCDILVCRAQLYNAQGYVELLSRFLNSWRY